MGRLLKSEKMGGLRCLLLVLLSCLEAVGGEGSGSECSQPTLPNGYLVPEKQSYSHHENISYSCEKDYKPAVEGWWAIINCENGTWSPKPECIDLNACTAPDVPDNAKLRQNPTNWYPNGNSARFDCVKGYELDGPRTIKCENGEWTSTVMCKKRSDTCGEPPFVNHAVITQKYQDVFAVNEKVQYKCEDFFTLEGSDECFCQSGGWSTPPTCKLPTPAPSEESRPVGHGDGGRAGPVGQDRQPDRTHSLPKRVGHGAGGSGPVEQDRQPDRTYSPPQRVTECGVRPVLDNGVIVYLDDLSLTYKCRLYYKLQGPEKVVCNSEGEWSPMPTCLEPCIIPKGSQPNAHLLMLSETIYITRGGNGWFSCIWSYYFATGTCIDGQMTYGSCECHHPYNHCY